MNFKDKFMYLYGKNYANDKVSLNKISLKKLEKKVFNLKLNTRIILYYCRFLKLL